MSYIILILTFNFRCCNFKSSKVTRHFEIHYVIAKCLVKKKILSLYTKEINIENIKLCKKKK